MLSKGSLRAGKRAVPFRCHAEPVCESHSVPRQHRRVWTQRTGETIYNLYSQEHKHLNNLEVMLTETQEHGFLLARKISMNYFSVRF